MKHVLTGIVSVVVALGLFWSFMPQEEQLGATTEVTTVTNPWTFSQNLTLTADATVNGGTVNVTTSNTATSTIVAGCYQFYATSTATAHRFQASTTPGIMYSAYGTCPNS